MAGRRSVYTVAYNMTSVYNPKTIQVIANNKGDAYDKATYEAIPEKEGSVPYSSWLYSVTYQNGRYYLFNNCEGNAY